MTSSLRNRLLIGIIGGMILLLTVFSLLIYVVIRSALLKQFDTSLASVARILAASVELDGEEIELEFEVQQMSEFRNTEHPTHYQLWGPDGTVLAKSPLLGTEDILHLKGSLNELVLGTSRDKNSQPQRMVGLKFVPWIADSHDEDKDEDGGDVDKVDEDDRPPIKGQEFTLVVARDASGLQGQLRFLCWLLLIASAAVIALSLLLATIVVRRGLSPLNSIAAEIATIREDNLTTRIDTGDVPAEVVPIKNRLNELLSRLEASFNRERQFNADIAHELRTPLAGIRSTIEVTLTRHRNNDEYKKVLADCQGIVEHMQTMVNNLLMLARLDTQQISLRTEQIRLAELVNSSWHPFSDRALERQIVFENRIGVEMTCESDPEHLSMVFVNLMDNAVEYADEGGRIWTTARRTDNCVEIAVSNTGCRLTAEQVSQAFDCFWRGDSSRSDTGAHCGLGLALAQRIVRALRGSVTAEVQGGTLAVRLTLPATAESDRARG